MIRHGILIFDGLFNDFACDLWTSIMIWPFVEFGCDFDDSVWSLMH